MPRPCWPGQIQISLVFFGVKLFPATYFSEIKKVTAVAEKFKESPPTFTPPKKLSS